MTAVVADQSRSLVDLEADNWVELRAQAHRMLDDMLDYQQHIRSRPLWHPASTELREHYQQALPQTATPLAELHEQFMTEILPHAVGNVHPGFMGWVHGGGTTTGMLAEMLAAGLNANLGGRNQLPLEVERQITLWMRELFGFPATAQGVFVTGTSQANLLAVLIARQHALGPHVRAQGLWTVERPLVAYAARGAHQCISRALEAAGIGSAQLRLLPVDEDFRMQPAALGAAIAADKAAGLQPFLVVATVGSVDVGAIDPLPAIAEIARAEQLWLHVDGAYAALARLAPELAFLLDGIEQADSIAFDFHKWLQVPYDAGFVLVRDGTLQLETFASEVSYLGRAERGLAANSPWPCDLGLDLSRGFRALKTWFTFKAYGIQRLGAMIYSRCLLARQLAERIAQESRLELLAPVNLNIVCYRYRFTATERLDELNAELVIRLQESACCAPSSTRIHGQLAIRAAINNHRTQEEDIQRLLAMTLQCAQTLEAES